MILQMKALNIEKVSCSHSPALMPLTCHCPRVQAGVLGQPEPPHGLFPFPGLFPIPCGPES